jgi:hypothetical protein
MEDSKKIRISSDFVFVKAFFIVIIVICSLILYYDSRPAVAVDVKTLTEYKFLLITLIIILGFLFTRPGVYYDNANLYIKKIRKEEMSIPLENIKTLSRYSAPRGGDFYRIKYINPDNKPASIWFYVGIFSEAMPKFITAIKSVNTDVRFDI